MKLMMSMKSLLIVALATISFIGCSGKNSVKEYDKSAFYWYKNIVNEVASDNLDKADNLYISLRSEHMRSPLLPTATMFLAQAHMEEQEFIMADYYLDEYLKKYASKNSIEQAKFLKIKAAFLGIKDINKDQKLMIDTLRDIDIFTKTYSSSIYRPVVETLKVRLHMSQYMLNENISRLYARMGKDAAAKIYKEKNANSPLNIADIKAPKVGFLDKIFN